MNEVITILLPESVSDQSMKEMQTQIAAIEGVDGAGEQGERGLGASDFGLWVQMGDGVLGIADKAMSIIMKIVEMVKGKGIENVEIELVNKRKQKIRIKAGKITQKDLAKLMKEMER